MPMALPLIAAGLEIYGGVAAGGVLGGMMIAGGALSAVGTISGNKDLTMAGGVIGLAGGVGSLATSATSATSGMDLAGDAAAGSGNNITTAAQSFNGSSDAASVAQDIATQAAATTPGSQEMTNQALQYQQQSSAFAGANPDNGFGVNATPSGSGATASPVASQTPSNLSDLSTQTPTAGNPATSNGVVNSNLANPATNQNVGAAPTPAASPTAAPAAAQANPAAAPPGQTQPIGTPTASQGSPAIDGGFNTFQGSIDSGKIPPSYSAGMPTSTDLDGNPGIIQQGMNYLNQNSGAARVVGNLVQGGANALGQQEAIKTNIALQEQAQLRNRARQSAAAQQVSVPHFQASTPKG